MTRIEKWAPKRQQMQQDAERFVRYVNELEEAKDYYRTKLNEQLFKNAQLSIDKNISDVKLRIYETSGS